MLLDNQILQASRIFLKAAQEGNLFLIESLFEPLFMQVTINEIVDDISGGNPLHWAAENGHLEIVKYFVKHKPSLIDLKSYNGSTAILNATLNSYEEIVKCLLQHNANPAIANQFNQNALTAAEQSTNPVIKEYLQEYRILVNKNFIDAIEQQQLALGKEWLDKGADIETPMYSRDNPKVLTTALFYCCTVGNEPLVSFLIDRKANVNVIFAKNGFSLLHEAVFYNHHALVSLLLSNANVKRDVVDLNGNTALKLAYIQGRQSIIDLMSGSMEKSQTVKREVSDTIKNNTFLFMPSPIINKEEILEERFSKLMGREVIPNRLSANLAKSNSQKKSRVTLETLRETVNALKVMVDKIALAAQACITAINVKWTHPEQQKMGIDSAVLDRYLAQLRQSIDSLHNAFFNTDKICDISQMLVSNYKLINAMSVILNETIDSEYVFSQKIFLSQEYKKDYWVLFDEMRLLRTAAEQFIETLRSLHDGHSEIVSDENSFSLN